MYHEIRKTVSTAGCAAAYWAIPMRPGSVVAHPSVIGLGSELKRIRLSGISFVKVVMFDWNRGT